MVSIDNVYRTVLNILNKENRGYITPSEFNTLAKQAQTEIFEMYFTTQYRIQQGPMSDGDYSDIMRNIEEKITLFDNTSDVLVRVDQIAQYPVNFYRLGVALTDANAIHITEVSHKDVLYINQSPLTAPTVKQPVYTRHEGGIRVYPDDTDAKIVYVRQPAIPQWVGTTMAGQLIPTDTQLDPVTQLPYQNFELHASEEPELVAKILAYSGVIVRAADIVQAAASKEQQIATDNG